MLITVHKIIVTVCIEYSLYTLYCLKSNCSITTQYRTLCCSITAQYRTLVLVWQI